MANVAIRKVLQRHPSETIYGSLLAGAITNGDYDLILEPGHWYITLFVNANAVSAGTISAVPLDAAGNALSEEPYFIFNSATAGSSAFTLIDIVGPLTVIAGSPAGFPQIPPVGIYGTIRFTIASIAGAGATNRIDYVATRVM